MISSVFFLKLPQAAITYRRGVSLDETSPFRFRRSDCGGATLQRRVRQWRHIMTQQLIYKSTAT